MVQRMENRNVQRIGEVPLKKWQWTVYVYFTETRVVMSTISAHNHANTSRKKKSICLYCFLLRLCRQYFRMYVDTSCIHMCDEEERDCSRDKLQRKYAFQSLPNHNWQLNTPVEPMHLINNIVEHLVCLLSGAEDSHKVRAEYRNEDGFAAHGWSMESQPFLLPPFHWPLMRQKWKLEGF